MSKWIKGLPVVEGNYWLWGYRYGKISCGNPTKPEMMLMKVRKVSNGIMYVADGQFLFEGEAEEPYYMKMEFPKPPYEG